VATVVPEITYFYNGRNVTFLDQLAGLFGVALASFPIDQAVDDFYDELLENIVQMLLRSYPKADIGPIRELVQILALMSEGIIVLYGIRKERAVKIERVIELATPLLKSISPHI
jgi:hypothetical protein